MVFSVKLKIKCALLRAHFFILLLVALTNSFNAVAHNVVLSEYSLSYVNNQWILTFKQKTSYLRDAIYETRSDLKGINLNSEVFKEATAEHIITNLSLKYRGEVLLVEPIQMKYGGLSFESTFSVEGLPNDPDFLTIKTDAFDAHEHSIVLFRVTKGTEGYLHYFNQEQRLATFDFTTRSYTMEETESIGSYKSIIYGVLTLIVVAVIAKLFLRRAKSAV